MKKPTLEIIVRSALLQLKKISVRTNALLVLFLLPLLSACGITQIKYVQTPHVPIPASLLSDCMPPLIPDELTWGDSLALNGELLTVIELCNMDKANIHQIEARRNEP